ncbi:hypothetical protein SLEP1_g58406 [Rubroshorea leprosula]|uniref:Uncharacterized protein n=1 Tax=Rubroshorea leprosula TaxID=152421 RepID=A0AAV5MPB1_9ROSI|nr:hypothetical protein SLEP1_g58406 [Rubroshorea leprosula]
MSEGSLVVGGALIGHNGCVNGVLSGAISCNEKDETILPAIILCC